jgi:hypothetical protein
MRAMGAKQIYDVHTTFMKTQKGITDEVQWLTVLYTTVGLFGCDLM